MNKSDDMQDYYVTMQKNKKQIRQSVMFVHINFILIVPATKWECMNTLKQHKNVATIQIQYLQNIQTKYLSIF